MKNLLAYNTFKINSTCDNLFEFYDIAGLKLLLTSYGSGVKVLGGGSNVLMMTSHFDTIFINRIKGIQILDENEDYCLVEVGAGENWHQFVMWAVYHNLGGLENLALIPGTVGAAPIQNIGAYGTEQQSSFVSLKALNRKGLFTTVFENAVCEFGYRDSVFKNELKDQFIITHVTYRFDKKPIANNSYKDVKEKLQSKNITHPSIKDIAETVIEIRSAKLPDPKVIGNAGSFFKNPVISKSAFENLVVNFPDMPHYLVDESFIKIPAAWLIDQSGLKGYRKGDTGTHINQALVIVNHGSATGEEIFDMAMHIQKVVFEKFKVTIEPEVNIW